MENFRFYIETYGCKVNQYESEALRQAWRAKGGLECARPEEADFALINSCAITARAERNARNAVFRLRQAAPNARIILSGCAAQFYADFQPRKRANFARPDICLPQARKAELLRGPSALLESNDIDASPQALREISSSAGAGRAFPDFGILQNYGRARPVVKIQDGCSHGCAYCIVPQTRGMPRSRAPEEILAECRRLARAGYGEIVLSGVNLRQYAGGFWLLLRRLDAELGREFSGSLRLRISSIDPAMLNDFGIETLAQCALVCPHLHLSMQHGSQRVLARMGRGHYAPEQTLAAVRKLGAVWPIFGLGADFLTGFPGEDEADISELLAFIAAMPFTYAHVFPYSRRQGTPARNFDDQIAKGEKIARAKQLRTAIAAKREQFLRRQLDLAEMLIAVEDVKDGRCRGVNEFYCNCVFEKPPQARGLARARACGSDGEELAVAIIT